MADLPLGCAAMPRWTGHDRARLPRSYPAAGLWKSPFGTRRADDLNTGSWPSRDFSKIAVDELTDKQAKAEHARLEAEIRQARRALLPEGRADGFGRGIRRAAPPLRGDRGALSRTCARWRACRARSAPRRRAASPRSGTRCRCCRCRTPSTTRTWPISSAASAASSISRRTSRSRSPPSRRSTGCRCRCATRTASWCTAPRAATAPRARTSPPISARSRRSRTSSRARTSRRSARCAARST